MRLILIGVLMAVGLTACGQQTGTRVASGGAIGAGGGLAIGLATGGIGPVVGALVGGGAGAAIGAALPNQKEAAPPRAIRQPVVNPQTSSLP
jgi:hypothetical protein